MSAERDGALLERIRRQVVVDEGGCWVWQGTRALGGYGRMNVGSRSDQSRRRQMVHRVTYELLVGPIPDGLTIDHLCSNPPCCNPEHLEPVTQRENNYRSTRLVTTQNAMRMSCVNGHPLQGENVRLRADGGRVCRTCQGWTGRIPIIRQPQVCAQCGAEFFRRYKVTVCSKSCSNRYFVRKRRPA